MSRVRAIGVDGNWLYGKGRNDFLTGNAAIGQQISSRLKEFQGDCFWNLGAGLNWWKYLGGDKDQTEVNLAVSAIILNTNGVTGIKQLSVNLDHVSRIFTIQYQVQTIYSVLSGNFSFDLNGSA